MNALLKIDDLTRQLMVRTCSGQAIGAPFADDIYLSSFQIVGAYYYQAGEIAKSLYAGQPLVLRREPDNAHDPYAIEVFAANSDKLGYLPRSHNKIPARLMDAGNYLHAKLARIECPDGRDYENAGPPRMRVRVYMQNV